MEPLTETNTCISW